MPPKYPVNAPNKTPATVEKRTTDVLITSVVPNPCITLEKISLPKKTGIFGKSKEAPKKPAADKEKPKTPVKAEAAEEVVPEDYDDKEEMDPDEFAQYACKYASEIDCSITGKSLLALYERIEMMEEDEVRLTKAAAVDLIEEAADKAEKKSLGKKIAGLFSPTYTKEGLLILHEKDFFD